MSNAPTHTDVIRGIAPAVKAHRAAGNTEQAANLAGPMAAIMAARSGQSVEQMRAASRAARIAEMDRQAAIPCEPYRVTGQG